ncbi:MAG: hypothetical protein SW833_15200 [Cyanobacteriota bacterium]|nr:hypothetical protein [Cyanobacteriota bacterium]
MNSDMEDNSDFVYRQILNWLKSKSTADSSCSELGMESENSDFPHQEQKKGSPDPLESMLEAHNAEVLEIDDPLSSLEIPLTWEEEEEVASQVGGSAQSVQPTNMGEIPIVQKRFQALLKRRLQAEIERHPPRFPWEMETADLPNYRDDFEAKAVPTQPFWVPQLLAVLPVEMPEAILARLLEACAETINSLKPSEAKTVRAASYLFPDRLRDLNDMAGRIRLSLAPSRLPQEEQQRYKEELVASLPRSYEGATTEQQMALSLLAAREIIDTLTLTLSREEPTSERQWQTTAGFVLLRSEYPPRSPSVEGQPLRVSARLPKGGSLTLQTNQESAIAERTYPGALSVELFDWQPGQTYPVTVNLAGTSQKPLTFAIVCR